MNKKKKIVFFDTWITALRHIDIIALILYKEFDLVFLSIDQFHNKLISSDQKKANIDCYNSRKINDIYYDKIVDLSQYNFSITKFFKDEKPDIAVTISIHNLDHRWFNSVSQIFKVPCFFIMHGLKGDSVDVKMKIPLNIFYLAKRITFYNLLFFYYKRDIRKSDFSREKSMLLEWIELIFFHHKYKFIPSNTYDVKYIKGFITDISDIDFFKSRYPSLKTCRFIDIGPIDIIKVEADLLKYKHEKEFALFIGQPLGADGIISQEKYLDNLKAVQNYFFNNGIQLRYRPHPSESKTILNKIKKLDIMIENDDISLSLSKSFLVLGYFSTLLLTCIKLSFPVISFRLVNVPHPKAFFNKPNSFVYNNFKEFQSLFDISKLNKFEVCITNPNMSKRIILDEFRNVIN
jgi:hypothetical protein